MGDDQRRDLTDFSGGVVSRKMDGRVKIEAYRTMCQTIENLLSGLMDAYRIDQAHTT